MGIIIVAIDALFGLPRKKSAGSSYRSPLYGDLHYLDKSSVDQFVQDYSKPKAVTVVSSFVVVSMDIKGTLH